MLGTHFLRFKTGLARPRSDRLEPLRGGSAPGCSPRSGARLLDYDKAVGIDWEWLAADGTTTKAPLGGPKDRHWVVEACHSWLNRTVPC